MPAPLVLLGSSLAAPFLEAPILFPPERAAADPVAEPEIRLLISEETPELLGGLVLDESETIVETYAGIARVTLHQQFINPYAAAAGAYLLPLPDGAILDAAEITCGGTLLAAEVAPRSAHSEGKPGSPFMLDAEGVFAWELSEVCAGPVAVTVQYVLSLESEGGRYSLDIPAPPPEADGLPWEAREAPTRSLTVYLDERMPISGLDAGDHALDLSDCAHRYGQVASISPQPGEPVHLSWALSGAAAVAYQPDPEQPGYLAITIEPEVLGRIPEAARELLFVVDSSCSVRGAPYEMAQATILTTLSTLTPADTFNLYPLDAGTPPLFDSPQPADDATRQAAAAWLKTSPVRSAGSTDGLRAALDLPPAAAHRQLLLLTDGHLDEDALRSVLRASDSPARIHPVGLGPYANRALLLQLAAEGRGSAIWPEPGESPDDTAARLAADLEAPALRDVVIDWGGLEIVEQLPAVTPDMPADAPLRLLARYAPGQDGPTTVRIQGMLDATPIALELTVPAADPGGEALAPLWAGEKIRALSLQGDRDPRAVREEIVAVALQHGVASRYTAIVGPDATPLRAPAARPEAVSTALTALEWSEAPPVALTAPPPQPVRRLPPRRVRMSTVGMNLPSGESTGDIIRIVDAKQAQIETCYQDRLQVRPDLEGSVAIQVDVVSGQVAALALAENTTGDARLAKCALRRIQGWEYPDSVTGQMYLPFALSTAD